MAPRLPRINLRRTSLDYRQARHWSLYSDMQVLADTVGAVLRQRGAE